MLVVLGDLIVDISMRLPKFPVGAGTMHRLSYLEIGPGGATNIAIMAARFGLPVSCLGEVGDDTFGEVVVNGLKREGIDTDNIVVTPDAETPVAVVVVDVEAEPSYLGSPGSLHMSAFPPMWRGQIQSAEAFFADGWAEHRGVPALVLEGFRVAREAGVKTFFDPGPGNPDVDDAWMADVIPLADVLLLNRAEAERLTGLADAEAAGKALLEGGPELVVMKLGAGGVLLITGDEVHHVEGYRVDVQDKTGAGDSVAGAVIYGVMNGFPLLDLAVLANLIGAAKVQKLGTGHNMPTLGEIRAMMERFQVTLSKPLPG